MHRPEWDRFLGCIAAGGFASGDCVVVGSWRDSPLGSFVDVMWVRPDGERILLAPTPAVAELVADLYRFDRVMIVPVTGGWDGGAVAVAAGPLRVRLEVGPRDWRSWVFASRPAWLRRRPWWVALEDRLGRPVVGALIGGAEGVRAVGVAPGGQRECYSADDWRPVTRGSLAVDGVDAGALGPLRPNLGIGLSAFPNRPALVHVCTLVERACEDHRPSPPVAPHEEPVP